MQSLFGPIVGVAAALTIVVGGTSIPTNPLSDPERGSTQAETMLVATLTSTELVGRAGPPNATGSVVINLRPITNEVCYNVVTRGITGTAAHIHKGAKGSSGPVSVPFTAPKDGATAGCAKVDAPLLTDIGTNPTNYHVNVHTTEFPQGAIRGQLGKPLGRSGG